MTFSIPEAREATVEEILKNRSWYIDRGRQISFRHFTLELPSPHARNGVQHRRHSNSRIHLVEGKPFVRHHGKLEPLTATMILTGPCAGIVTDYRIKSEHLPSDV